MKPWRVSVTCGAGLLALHSLRPSFAHATIYETMVILVVIAVVAALLGWD